MPNGNWEANLMIMCTIKAYISIHKKAYISYISIHKKNI